MMPPLASETVNVGYALSRLREIVTELDSLHSLLQGEAHGDVAPPAPALEGKPQKIAGFRDWLNLKTNRAAEVFLALADAPGEMVSFETFLATLKIRVSKQIGTTANNRKLVHVYMWDLRRGLAAAGFQDVIQCRPKLGYVLSASSTRSILKAFDRQKAHA